MAFRKQVAGYYCTNIGNGMDNEIEVRHDLDCPFPVVQVYEAATIGYTHSTYRIVDANTVMISFGRPPDEDEFVVVVIG